MTDNFQSRHQLIGEINQLKQRIADLEAEQGSGQTPAVVQQVEEKYRSLFENASDSIFIIDPYTGRILDANRNASRRLQYTHPELVALNLPEIEIREEGQGFKFSWESSFSGTNVYECQHRCKDGTMMPVEVSSRLIHVDKRDVLQNLVRDLSKRKEAEKQELELLIERERLQLLSDFITQASHHFKTPLSVIGSRSYLLGKLDSADQRKPHVAVINDEIRQVTKLVDGLIMLSTLANIRRLDLVPVDLNQVTQQVIDSRKSSLQDKQLTVHLHQPDQAVQVPGHFDYLFSGVEHLLDNAIQNSPSPGEIMIHTGYVDEFAALEIEDAGSGISQNDLPHIFETFYRADKAGTTSGLGLGLPIAKMILELHHGLIEVETEEGRGSIFRVLLPVRQE
ncbi:MAG TPA: PAS domain-containing sensor histidine kinase [Phototrophicaceae bacterium]|nr:PAS domain-containing sensor histidine kinase [Phototrophicaceae bacterium]